MKWTAHLIPFLLLALASVAFAEDTQAAKELWQPYYITPRTGDQHLDLSADWFLNHTDAPVASPAELPPENWIQVNRPTSVHWALHQAGQLPNPYAHLNSKQYEWVEDAVWYYRKSFDAPIPDGPRFHLLCFDGIDYLARIWLNGQYLGEHEGMFGGPAIDVTALLQEKANELIVEVRSGKEFREKGWPGRRNPHKIIKGWEFTGGVGAEPFYTVGMWQGVRLESVPQIHLERPHLVTESISEQKATLSLDLDLYANSNSLDYTLHPRRGIQSHPNHGRYTYATYRKEELPVDAELRIEFHAGEELVYAEQTPIDVYNQRTWISRRIEIDHPKLWWPNGLGEPHLYRVSLSLILDHQSVDTIAFDYGIRKIETVRSAGPKVGDYWEKWQFKVNGRPFFVKGINWMPADLLLDLPPARYDWLVSLAQQAGVQMFRIWGAGLIETEAFYRACNRAGILVWAEYSMANWDAEKFPQDVYEAQVMWTLFRLRNHPSLAVHSGGNEYNPYSEANTPLTGILERAVATFDPDAIYRRASPDGGSMHAYDDKDATWWPKDYRDVPFMAETGLHSITEARSLYEIIDPHEFEDLGNLYHDSFQDNHPEFLHHFVEFQANRVPRMMSRASHMMDMRTPTLEALAEASQVAAGEWYQVISELMQTNHPTTTGILPWTFKRPWPVVSAIHTVDGFGQPSAPYYFLKRSYQPTRAILAMDHTLRAPGESFPLPVAILRNRPGQSQPLTVAVNIYDDAFQLQMTQARRVEHLADGPRVTRIEDFQPYQIPADYADRFFFVAVELRDAGGNLITRADYWPRSLTTLKDPATLATHRESPQPWPNFEKGPWLKDAVAQTPTQLEAILLESLDRDGQTDFTLQLKNTGTVPAFMTRIDVTGAKRRFVVDDNYFWLAPGEQRLISGTIDWRENPSGKTLTVNLSAWNAQTVALTLP